MKKLLTKEECEKALETINYIGDYEDGTPALLEKQEPRAYGTIKQLMEEHFELVRKYKVLEDDLDTIENDYKNVLNELDKYKHEYFSMCDLIENPRAYTFEELKLGMLVWDDLEKELIRIIKTLTKEDCKYLYGDENKKVFIDDYYAHAREFEDGRFYPPTKALQYQK